MKTSLRYSVQKEENFNFETGKYEKHIVSRGFEFCVTGAKTEQEHDKVISAFRSYLANNGIQADGFGSGSWKEALKYGSDGQKDFYFLSIACDDIDNKKDIEQLYKDWKNRIWKIEG